MFGDVYVYKDHKGRFWFYMVICEVPSVWPRHNIFSLTSGKVGRVSHLSAMEKASA